MSGPDPHAPDSRHHPELSPSIRSDRRPVSEAESRRANGPDWDRYADEYQATHGAFLGDAGFVWGPEGLTEDEAGVLGDVTDKDVLEVGSGAGQCSRWVRARGGRAIGLDLSWRHIRSEPTEQSGAYGGDIRYIVNQVSVAYLVRF